MKKLAIANGKYQKDGQEKTRWVNVGVIGVGSNGKEYMMLDPTINLAGFAREAGRDMVMVSIFDDSHQQAPQQQQQQPQYQQQPQQNGQYQHQQAPQQDRPPVEVAHEQLPF